MEMKPYRIGTDYKPENGGKIRATTRGPIRTRTKLVALPSTALPTTDDHERAALALAKLVAGEGAIVRLASSNGTTKRDFEVFA